MATKTILVVDPDTYVSALVADVLAQAGYKVIVVPSLNEAETLLSRSHADLIITEAFDQPHIFDFDPAFLTRLRSAAANTPVILCSTYPSTDYLFAGRYGLAEVVPKPFDIGDLLKKVNKALVRNGSSSG